MTTEETRPFLLVVGAPRSGTTLLQAFLNSHPRIATPPESHILRRLAHLAPALDRGIFDLEQWKRAILQNGRLEKWPVPVDDLLSTVPLRTATSTREATQRLFQGYARSKYADIYGDKTPANTLSLRRITSMLGPTTVIHVVRNPHDTVRSIVKAQGFGPNDSRLAVWYWANYVDRARRYGHLAPESYIEVSYEDLVHDPPTSLRACCEHLGVDYDDAMLDHKEAGLLLGSAQRYPGNHQNLTGEIQKRTLPIPDSRDLSEALDQAAVVYPLAAMDRRTHRLYTLAHQPTHTTLGYAHYGAWRLGQNRKRLSSAIETLRSRRPTVPTALSGQRHVCHFTTVHRPDDTRVRHKQCAALLASNFRVTLIAPSSPCLPEPVDGVHRVRLRHYRSRARRLAMQLKLLRILLASEADAYQTHDPELIPLLLLIRMLGRPSILDIHEDLYGLALSRPYIPGSFQPLLRRLLMALERVAARKADLVIAARPEVYDRLVTYGGRSELVRNLPCPGEFPHRAELDDYLGRDSNALYIGAISDDRGVRTMVHLGVDLAQLGYRGVRLGGPCNDPISRQLASSPVEGVAFDGHVPRSDLRAFMSTGRVGIALLRPIPIYIREVPTKLMEYMAAGLPVVASDFDCNRDLLETAGCGIVVNPTDQEEVLGAVQWLLENPEEAYLMGQRGRDYVFSKSSWDQEAKVYIDAISHTIPRY